MGLAGNGGYNNEDYVLTFSAPDGETVRIDGSAEEAKLCYGLHAERGGTAFGRAPSAQRPLPAASAG